MLEHVSRPGIPRSYRSAQRVDLGANQKDRWRSRQQCFSSVGADAGGRAEGVAIPTKLKMSEMQSRCLN